MNFTDKTFVPFIAIVYSLWLLCRGRYRLTVAMLVAASLVFYGHNHWWLIFLILSYCLVDWIFGLWIGISRRPGWVLAGGITFNLGVLAYWKYTPMLMRSIVELLTTLDISTTLQAPHDWLLPWGISFYTFTGIAYLVDVYRRETPAERNLLRFCLYKTFFPQLVAGPILRPQNFLVHLQPNTLPRAPLAPLEAALLLGCGYFKKMVLADRIALSIDPFFTHVTDSSTAGVWAVPYVYLYALQIYFDFSAYTDIARGFGLLFGFRWPENFNLPYLATSVADFWKRWHMSLSMFLRDYLYISLGGNRGGRWRTCFNLMLTMLLGGLWHGASWSFVLWGGLHGSFLVLHRLWSGTRLGRRLAALSGPAGMAYRLCAVVVTFHLVCLAWCFFRLTDLQASVECVRKWLLFDADKILVGNAADPSLLVLLACYGVFVLLARMTRPYLLASGTTGAAGMATEPAPEHPLRRGFAWGFGVAMLILALLLSPGGGTPAFIYFQF
jgi:D-alanyl-lipoteichoic acid acyltransferase DltB (MBOAT superfamily)